MNIFPKIENLHILSEDTLVTPAVLKQQFPLTLQAVETVAKGQVTIKNILDRKDPRLFVVVGPCSIHDVKAAKEYAEKLNQLAQEVSDTLFLVMRVYFEKPRTQSGWQGLIYDPFLNETYQIEAGLKIARQLLLDIANIGLPAAGEALDLVSPQYLQDLFSWTAIGARTTESQTHRKMASGFTSAVGFKNRTDGDWNVALNAMKFSARPNHFLSVNPEGQVAVIRTKGNSHTHLVLRGGEGGPNYSAANILQCEQALKGAQLKANIMVDCSHANSGKDPHKQLDVAQSIIEQIVNGNQSIVGLMIESNLNWGNQAIGGNMSYGVSVTDACVDWATTETMMRTMREELKELLPRRREN